MHRTFDQLPAYLIVMTLSMAGLKLLNHAPELSWLAVLAPALLLPALLICAAVIAGAALVIAGAVNVARTVVHTRFTRTTTPKE
jgi:hypothetical protein